MTESQQARRELTGNMPTGENRLRQYVVEDRPNEADYEQDRWIAIESSQQLWHIVQGWARCGAEGADRSA
jgi:hypothetical protein